jgi:hypothetical protein
VAVTNGDRVSIPGCSKNLCISIGEGFNIDCYVSHWDHMKWC